MNSLNLRSEHLKRYLEIAKVPAGEPLPDAPPSPDGTTIVSKGKRLPKSQKVIPQNIGRTRDCATSNPSEESSRKRSIVNNHPPKAKLPSLLAIGPDVVEKSNDLRRLRVIIRAYRDGAKSLRKAHLLSCQNATAWGVDERLIAVWEDFRDAASVAESLFSLYFGTSFQLFVKLGEGMPWIGVTDQAAQADQLAEDFLAWYDHPPLSSNQRMRRSHKSL